MLDHLELLFGFVGAVAAAVRVLHGVREVVVSQARRPAEGLLAQAAHIRPIVRVLPLVGLQQEPGLEAFAALLTDERAHVSVLCIPVDFEGICSVGAVVALLAGERLLPWRRGAGQTSYIHFFYFNEIWDSKLYMVLK